MSVKKDPVLEKDLQRVASASLPYGTWKNKTFFITGATGLIGSLAIKALLHISKTYDLNLHIIAVARNPQKVASVFSDIADTQALSFLYADLHASQICCDKPIDYIIHAAAVTTSKLLVSEPVESCKISLNGTMAILDLAVQKKVSRMVYLSSMEVYGVLSESKDVFEDDLGYVDLHAVRSCYPESKRMCECLCTAYAKKYGLPVCAIRLAQTFGAGVSPSDNRVFAQFAKSAIAGTDIVLHTDGSSEGNYIYTTDALLAIFQLLFDGKAGESYNAANEACHTTILDMAKLVSHNICNNHIRVVIDLPEDVSAMGYAPKTKLRLRSDKLRALGWQPEVDLETAYRRLIKSLEVTKTDE